MVVWCKWHHNFKLSYVVYAVHSSLNSLRRAVPSSVCSYVSGVVPSGHELTSSTCVLETSAQRQPKSLLDTEYPLCHIQYQEVGIFSLQSRVFASWDHVLCYFNEEEALMLWCVTNAVRDCVCCAFQSCPEERLWASLDCCWDFGVKATGQSRADLWCVGLIFIPDKWQVSKDAFISDLLLSFRPKNSSKKPNVFCDAYTICHDNLKSLWLSPCALLSSSKDGINSIVLSRSCLSLSKKKKQTPKKKKSGHLMNHQTDHPRQVLAKAKARDEASRLMRPVVLLLETLLWGFAMNVDL